MKFDKSMIWKYIVLFVINALLLAVFFIGLIVIQYPTTYLFLGIYCYYVLPIYAVVYGIVSWLLTKNLLFPNLLLIICLGVIPRVALFFTISILIAAGSFVIELILYAITKAFKRKKQVGEEQSASQFEDEIVPAGLSEK